MLSETEFSTLLERLHSLRQKAQAGMESDDWHDYLELAVTLCEAQGGCILQRKQHEQEQFSVAGFRGLPEQDLAAWLKLAEFRAFLQRAMDGGSAVRPPNPQLPWPQVLVAIQLQGEHAPLLVLALLPEDAQRINDVLLRAFLISDILPAGDGKHSKRADSAQDTQSIMPLLTVLNELYRARHFQTAAYALVNGVVSQFPQIDQVVFGWRKGVYMRVRAISHYERFEAKTDTVRYMEAALEEAADQGLTLQMGVDTPEAGVIQLAHRQLATHLASRDLVSLPLFDSEGETPGALLLMSYNEAIPQQIQHALQFVVQTALAHFQALQDDEAGLIRLWFRRAGKIVGRMFGPENLWVKVSLVTIAALFFISLVVQVPHRVKGTAQFVTDETRVLVAPFNAVVADVRVTSGDAVDAGETVLSFDTQEIMLQLAELESELQRNQAELDKARAEFTNVEMAIAGARVEQTKARIGQVRYLLAQASLNAPFSGIIVEGDRRELISAPVTKGQALMRIAKLQGLYLLIEVSDLDIQHVQAGSLGEFSLVAQPEASIPLQIERIIPMASAAAHGAIFQVRANVAQEPEDWWRPGMTGVARIDAGKRSLLWVLFHKSWNQLRLFFWW